MLIHTGLSWTEGIISLKFFNNGVDVPWIKEKS
jgi:hypothetical protein